MNQLLQKSEIKDGNPLLTKKSDAPELHTHEHEHTHEHDHDEQKNCCGDCKGGGACKRIAEAFDFEKMVLEHNDQQA